MIAVTSALKSIELILKTRASVSFLEIYCERVYDLLAPSDSPQEDIAIRENSRGELIVSGVALHPIHSANEAQR